MSESIYSEEFIDEICANSELEVIDYDVWDEWNENNQDFYGSGVIRYAERWGKAMQYAIEQDGYALEDVADQLSHDADKEGITGFMYGAAVRVLASCWEYGEQLRVWHNRKYGVSDSDGVVNPAIISVE